MNSAIRYFAPLMQITNHTRLTVFPNAGFFAHCCVVVALNLFCVHFYHSFRVNLDIEFSYRSSFRTTRTINTMIEPE